MRLELEALLIHKIARSIHESKSFFTLQSRGIMNINYKIECIHESGLPRIHESGLPRIHESGLPRIHESGLPRIHESGLPRIAALRSVVDAPRRACFAVLSASYVLAPHPDSITRCKSNLVGIEQIRLMKEAVCMCVCVWVYGCHKCHKIACKNMSQVSDVTRETHLFTSPAFLAGPDFSLTLPFCKDRQLASRQLFDF